MDITTIWWGLAIMFLAIEAVSYGLISIWFCFGAIIAGVLSKFGFSQTTQIVIFLLSSGIFFVLLKKRVQKFVKPREENFHRVVGQESTVKGIDSNGNYELYIDGKHWIGKSDEELKINDKVEILKIEGIKLILKKK